MQKNLIISLLFSILIGLFAVLNAATIEVNLIFMKAEIPQAIVILVSATIGAIIVFSVDLVDKLKKKKTIKELTKRNKSLEEQLVGLESEVETLQGQVKELSKKPEPKKNVTEEEIIGD